MDNIQPHITIAANTAVPPIATPIFTADLMWSVPPNNGFAQPSPVVARPDGNACDSVNQTLGT